MYEYIHRYLTYIEECEPWNSYMQYLLSRGTKNETIKNNVQSLDMSVYIKNILKF